MYTLASLAPLLVNIRPVTISDFFVIIVGNRVHDTKIIIVVLIGNIAHYIAQIYLHFC